MDAAIATNAVLAVVNGDACGIGGDAFWLIWDAAERRELALNGSGRSSVRADAEALRRSGLERLPLRGGLTVTVPGAVRSWGDAHDRYGRLPRAELLAPAIELATLGFPAWDGFIDAVEKGALRFAERARARCGLVLDLPAVRSAVATRRTRPAPGPGRDPHPDRR